MEHLQAENKPLLCFVRPHRLLSGVFQLGFHMVLILPSLRPMRNGPLVLVTKIFAGCVGSQESIRPPLLPSLLAADFPAFFDSTGNTQNQALLGLSAPSRLAAILVFRVLRE